MNIFQIFHDRIAEILGQITARGDFPRLIRRDSSSNRQGRRNG